jgi:hypothetical protein
VEVVRRRQVLKTPPSGLLVGQSECNYQTYTSVRSEDWRKAFQLGRRSFMGADGHRSLLEDVLISPNL